MSEKNLQFKPLSEGLGFHPFSNGLPYTPATPQRDLSRGAGAIAAGKPSFAFPQPASPAAVAAKGKVAPAVAKAPTTPVVPMEPLLRVFGWDYVGRRFFAFLIDCTLNLFLGMVVLVASLWPSLDVLATTNALLVSAAYLLFFNWALIAAQEVAFGTSIGKKLLGLRLEGGAIALLLRAVAFIPSSLFFGLGVLWCAFDQDCRGFHDLVTGIQPEENRFARAPQAP